MFPCLYDIRLYGQTQCHLFLERHGKIEKKHRKPDTHGIKLAVLFSLAEAVGFEPTSPLLDYLISSQGRYDHFDTLPWADVHSGQTNKI